MRAACERSVDARISNLESPIGARYVIRLRSDQYLEKSRKLMYLFPIPWGNPGASRCSAFNGVTRCHQHHAYCRRSNSRSSSSTLTSISNAWSTPANSPSGYGSATSAAAGLAGSKLRYGLGCKSGSTIVTRLPRGAKAGGPSPAFHVLRLPTARRFFESTAPGGAARMGGNRIAGSVAQNAR